MRMRRFPGGRSEAGSLDGISLLTLFSIKITEISALILKRRFQQVNDRLNLATENT
jgi:hypothetical protein